MIVPLFKCVSLYIDPCFGFPCCFFCIGVNFYLLLFESKAYPVMYFVSSYGIFTWVWMYLYFCVTYEIITTSNESCIRKIFCIDVFKKICLNPKAIRIASYVIIIGYLTSFSLWTPAEIKSSTVLLMFALSCIAMVFDLFMAIIKIGIFLGLIGIIYLISLVFCSKEQREKLMKGEETEGDQPNEIEFEEYTVNGSDGEGEDDDDEESKEQIGMRRMRIRRREQREEEVKSGLGGILNMVFRRGKKLFKKKEKTAKEKENNKELCPICQIDFEDKDEV